MKTDLNDIYKLIDDILKHREEVYSLWGKNKDNDYIFLGIFPDEEYAKNASKSVIVSEYEHHTGLKHERK